MPPRTNAKNSGQGLTEEDNEYDSDRTSSYDSEEHGSWPHFTIEILHGEGSPSLAGNTASHPKDAKRPACNVSDPVTRNMLVSTPIPSYQSRRRAFSREEYKHRSLNDLYLATRQFYTSAPADASSFVFSPLLEEGPNTKKVKKSLSEFDYPKPSSETAHGQKKVLNEAEASHVPRSLSPTGTITFQMALIATDKPR